MCNNYNCDKTLTSCNPLVINKIIKDGIMVFTSPVKIDTTNFLLDNKIIGPYFNEPLKFNEKIPFYYHEYSYWVNGKYYYHDLYKFLKKHNIDPEQDAHKFYKLNEPNLTEDYNNSVGTWIKNINNIKDKKLKDLFGVLYHRYNLMILMILMCGATYHS
jgi:hypothetical protein